MVPSISGFLLCLDTFSISPCWVGGHASPYFRILGDVFDDCMNITIVVCPGELNNL